MGSVCGGDGIRQAGLRRGLGCSLPRGGGAQWEVDWGLGFVPRVNGEQKCRCWREAVTGA